MNKLEEFLRSKKINYTQLKITKKDFCTEALFRPALDTPVSKIEKTARDLALHMQAVGPAIIQPDYKNGQVSVMWLDKEITSSPLPARQLSAELPIPLGTLSDSSDKTIDLVKAPHILVGGTTGSGKSWFLHCSIQHLLEAGAQVICIDPKMGEFAQYAKQKNFVHYKTAEETSRGLDVLIDTMMKRYAFLAQAGYADIRVYNQTHLNRQIQRIVVVIDEFTDLTAQLGIKFTNKVQQLAQKSRAAGIHIIAAAQNPSAKVFTGEVKANFPVRIAFRVASGVNSRVILDRMGAEHLKGAGDGVCLDDQGNQLRFRGYIPKFQEVKPKKAGALPQPEFQLKKRSLFDKIFG